MRLVGGVVEALLREAVPREAGSSTRHSSHRSMPASAGSCRLAARSYVCERRRNECRSQLLARDRSTRMTHCNVVGGRSWSSNLRFVVPTTVVFRLLRPWWTGWEAHPPIRRQTARPMPWRMSTPIPFYIAQLLRYSGVILIETGCPIPGSSFPTGHHSAARAARCASTAAPSPFHTRMLSP